MLRARGALPRLSSESGKYVCHQRVHCLRKRRAAKFSSHACSPNSLSVKMSFLGGSSSPAVPPPAGMRISCIFGLCDTYAPLVTDQAAKKQMVMDQLTSQLHLANAQELIKVRTRILPLC